MTRTTTESDACAILRLLVGHQIKRKGEDTEEYEYVDEKHGVSWNHVMICTFIGSTGEMTLRALNWLITRNLVYKDRNQYWITEQGIQLHREFRGNPHFKNDDAAFIDQVLTGMTPCGNPSPLKYDDKGGELHRAEATPVLPRRRR